MWFSYCPDLGFDEHSTAAEAQSEARKKIDIATENGPIPEWIGQICWGQIRGSAVMENTRPRGDDDPVEFDFISEVNLRDDVTEWRCNLCGGLVQFDGTAPSAPN